MKFIKDKTYHDISKSSYFRNLNNGKALSSDHDWEVVEPEGALLHDTNGSCFDATVYKI
ncbi:hypothetical protein PAJ34TS1_07300 [Paenibacillus azoreducens]|uniref:Uncharacterized protein n=1 Tax=Paenibacillus azoreducens TaxID=116718 RepID=A0A919YJ62_9BACL|nr:hypothetical protein J34TS1_62290 [Paenibacillus azoreducens]